MSECPSIYQDPPTHYGPGGSALAPANIQAWRIHQSLKVLGETTWRFYRVPHDPTEAEVLHLKLLTLAAGDHPPEPPGR